MTEHNEHSKKVLNLLQNDGYGTIAISNVKNWKIYSEDVVGFTIEKNGISIIVVVALVTKSNNPRLDVLKLLLKKQDVDHHTEYIIYSYELVCFINSFICYHSKANQYYTPKERAVGERAIVDYNKPSRPVRRRI